LGVAAAFITAFYMFRLVYMTFHGEFRGTEEEKHHLHESPWTMTLPLQVLGVLSVVGGLIGIPKLLSFGRDWNLIERFMDPVIIPIGGGEGALAEVSHHAVSGGVEWLLLAISLTVAVAGILVARSFYYGAHAFAKPRRLVERFPLLYKLVLNKYYVDEIYEATVIGGTVALARVLWEFDARVIDGIVNGVRHMTVGTSFLSGIFDLKIIDGLVNLVARLYDWASHYFRRLQVGFAQGYAMVMVLGAAALLAIYIIF